ncbi:MAG: CotH kinase family protein, partial [Verrucomicrobiae bacterium]|nr:CotH kinase family protein [Verrucomicrobiae bacterium]
DWILHGPYSDKSLLNNFLAFELHEKMWHYAVRRCFVEVFLDDTLGWLTYPADYKGVYVLLEKIEIDRNRVEIARMGPSVTSEPEVTGGYIFKKDKDSPGDLNFSTRGGAGFGAQSLKYHDPKPREINAAQRNWLRNYLIAFEEALYASDWLTRTGPRHYSAFIDVNSFVDNHWIVEFTKQIDGYRLSNYFSKDRNGKVKMEPVWDWNLSFGNADYLDGWNPAGWYWTLIDPTAHIWLRRLITGSTSTTARSGDPDFNQALVDRWSVLRTNILNPSNVLARIDEIAAYLDESKDRDFARWPRLNTYVWPNPSIYIQPTYSQIIANKKKWIQDRFAWIDSQMLRAPNISLPAGFIRSGSLLTITASVGSIYYTLDGADPRLPMGSINPKASVYTGPIRLDRNVRVFARARHTNSWSGPTVATFVTEIPKLRISEIMFDPAPETTQQNKADDPDNLEFIELLNIGQTPIDLDGFRLT